MIYAEVIGDPIGHSKSPIIHKQWLDRLGIEGDYRKTRVAGAELAAFIAARRGDTDWRGCNVTIPHKQAIIPLLDRVDREAKTIGAVNCVVREGGVLAGYNTDVDGIAAALDSTELTGRDAAVIGAGGGARALITYLARRDVEIIILARNPARAEELRQLAALQILPLDAAEQAFKDAAAIINASPLGMSGAELMPRPLIDAVRAHSAGVTLFDMVTTPAETEFLAAGRERGGRTVDGLTMLVGQAARAFECFYGAPPPRPDEALRKLLIEDMPDSA